MRGESAGFVKVCAGTLSTTRRQYWSRFAPLAKPYAPVLACDEMRSFSLMRVIR